MDKTICLIGAFDTKGVDYNFLREKILSKGHRVFTVNTGVLGSTDLFPVDVETDKIVKAADGSLENLREKKDRGEAMKIVSTGAATLMSALYREGKFDGIIGMGGSGGTSVITAAMRALPLGLPKVCVSTIASGDVSREVGTKDITMIPSIVDVAGVNRVSNLIYSRAAGAICGMVDEEIITVKEEKPIITASMFGNTTESVNACVVELTAKGYEVIVFHATGTGGKTMESLIDEGMVDAVLDITTTEWADTICGGVFDAGPQRLDAPGKKGIPHLIVPGCVDMANFGGPDTIPSRYHEDKRLFYEWNPSVTLLRTNREENEKMGKIFAEKANASTGPVAFLIPLKGVSILDGDGELFCDREADRAMFDGIKRNLKKDILYVEVDYNINDPEFSKKAVKMMLELIYQKKN